jgi:hypothetical protein
MQDSPIEANLIEMAAKQELHAEEFRRRVEERKEQLRKRKALPWYKKLFPFKVTIERI